MKTFIMMTKIAPKNADIIEVSQSLQAHTRNSSEWISDIKENCPEVKILAHYALLGPYDFMCIYEAPDEKIAAKVSMISRAQGTYQIESWNAMPSKEISDIIEGIMPGTSRTREY
jgi:uncharacterized protein with GYD domain